MKLMRSLLGTVVLAWVASASPVQAAEFNLFVKCQGTLQSSGKSKDAHVDLALRDNNETALISRSNVLPAGERLRYKQTPSHYTMTYYLRGAGVTIVQSWMGSTWVLWQPNLKRLATVRLAIDRQDGQLEGELRDANDDMLGTLAMSCDSVDPDELPQPKF